MSSDVYSVIEIFKKLPQGIEFLSKNSEKNACFPRESSLCETLTVKQLCLQNIVLYCLHQDHIPKNIYGM